MTARPQEQILQAPPPPEARARPAEDALLEVRNLKKYFPLYRGVFQHVYAHVRAVDGVSFSIRRGETFGLVGESGCGKTTVGRCILRLTEPTEGEVRFEEENILDFDRERMRLARQDMQVIFQDPYASLNPRMTIGDIVGEPFVIHAIARGSEKRDRVAHLLRTVGLDPQHMKRYPHEFSGGQRQRIGIARALALQPKLIIADEPVSALDVSIQAQVVNLLQDLQEKLRLTYLFIAHDLSVVEHISHRVGVMYLGKLVEVATSEELYENPLHPYTKALLSAVPVPDPAVKKERVVLPGDVPTPVNPPSGCRFRTRCPIAEARCAEEEPPLVEKTSAREGEHVAACLLVE
ncbi:MAG: dipeptide ABC transporter ATP-binding protein [Acidobacteriota bacterium]|nr:MAG: dipeptide ABC transporter ATP-binding protein [Acidobacteriota bacterium]